MGSATLLLVLSLSVEVFGLRINSEVPMYELDTPTEISEKELYAARDTLMQNIKLQRTPPEICNNLHDKWIFVRGDSTTRQVVKMMLAHTGIHMSEHELKQYFRKNCIRPAHSSDYETFSKQHPAYGHMPCWLNEKRCDWQTHNSRITFDWQHFVLEDREDFLFSRTAMAEDKDHDFKNGLPDVLVMGLPLHSCFHTNPSQWKAKESAQKDQNTEDTHFNQISTLVEKVRSVYDGPIIWIEASGVALKDTHQDFMRCLSRMNTELNRVVKNDARSHVVARQTIEQDWVSTHKKDQGIHKKEGCVEQIYADVCKNL